MTRHDPLLSVAFTAACLFHSDKEAQPLSSQSVGEVRPHHSWRWPYQIAGLQPASGGFLNAGRRVYATLVHVSERSRSPGFRAHSGLPTHAPSTLGAGPTSVSIEQRPLKGTSLVEETHGRRVRGRLDRRPGVRCQHAVAGFGPGDPSDGKANQAVSSRPTATPCAARQAPASHQAAPGGQPQGYPVKARAGADQDRHSLGRQLTLGPAGFRLAA